MLGMHGAVYANYAIDNADLLLAFGVRFDDRVTGKLAEFAKRAAIVHIDIDPAELGKNKKPFCSIFSNIKPALKTLNKLIALEKDMPDFSEWRAAIDVQRKKFPFPIPEQAGDVIAPQAAIELLCKMTEGKAIISTGVGQHQMWAAQHYKFDEPRNWLTSGGLGSMGFRLARRHRRRRGASWRTGRRHRRRWLVRHEYSRTRDVARGKFTGESASS